MVLSVPAFTANAILSARQINLLSGALGTLAGRAAAIALPQLAHTVTYAHAKAGYVLHRHSTALYAYEYLYYDIQVNAVGCRIDYDGTTIKTFTSTGRQRGILSLYEFPTAATHPPDWDLVVVGVYPTTEACDAVVYRLEELRYPAGYSRLNDPNALVDFAKVRVPIDLQKLADNATALDALSAAGRPGFAPKDVSNIDAQDDGTPIIHTVGTWYWPTPKTDSLAYRITLTKNPEQAGGADVVTAKVYVLGAQVGANLTYAGGLGEIIHEGEFSLAGIGRNVGELIPVSVTAEYTGPNPVGGRQHGFGGCTVHYLGEAGDALPGWAAFQDVAHGAQAEGDAIAPKLRDLWSDAALLAGDNGAGYAMDGFHLANGYPVGHAFSAYRCPVIFAGKQQGTPDLYGRYQYEMSFLRARDYLYYRAVGGELVYIGEDGEEQTQKLDDYTDDEEYQVFDLSKADMLSYGQWYRVRAPASKEANTLDWAMEV
jgi:hypothetical protein